MLKGKEPDLWQTEVVVSTISLHYIMKYICVSLLQPF